MDFLTRAWAALMVGDGATAAQELQYNEIARIRPLQILSASMERMRSPWASEWLDMPNGGLDGLTPRHVLSFDDHSSWDRVAQLFRKRDQRFQRHIELLRARAWSRHRDESMKDTKMTNDPDATPRNLAHLYHIHNQAVTAEVLGRRCAEARHALGLSIAEAATRCNVSDIELRRFEEHGEIGLESALRIIRGLSMDTSFDEAFRMPRFQSMDDLRAYAARTEVD